MQSHPLSAELVGQMKDQCGESLVNMSKKFAAAVSAGPQVPTGNAFPKSVTYDTACGDM